LQRDFFLVGCENIKLKVQKFNTFEPEVFLLTVQIPSSCPPAAPALKVPAEYSASARTATTGAVP